MKRSQFGSTGLRASRVSFGAIDLNDGRVSESETGHLLSVVRDLGVNVIYTARGYGPSKPRIGRQLAARRHEFVLPTKVGYGIPGALGIYEDARDVPVRAARAEGRVLQRRCLSAG